MINNRRSGTRAYARSLAPRFLSALLLVCLSAFTLLAHAEPPITADDAWVRAAPPGTLVLAGYMTLSNRGDADIALAGVTSPQFERVEMHESVIEGGVAYMDKLDGIVVPAGGAVALEPGGKHLMLIDPQTEIHAGDDVELVLTLDDGWELALTVPVRRAGADDDHKH